MEKTITFSCCDGYRIDVFFFLKRNQTNEVPMERKLGAQIKCQQYSNNSQLQNGEECFFLGMIQNYCNKIGFSKKFSWFQQNQNLPGPLNMCHQFGRQRIWKIRIFLEKLNLFSISNKKWTREIGKFLRMEISCFRLLFRSQFPAHHHSQQLPALSTD